MLGKHLRRQRNCFVRSKCAVRVYIQRQFVIISHLTDTRILDGKIDTVLNGGKIEKINEKKIYDSFFANSYIHDVRGHTIIVVASSVVAKTVMSGQYADLINSVIADLTEEEYTVEVYTEDEVNEKFGRGASSPKKEEVSKQEYFEGARVNPALTFDNFVVGSFNKEAHQAAKYVAENGGTLFNPLFIYSHSGLGKTHLLHAIGNKVLSSRMPNAKILYITANDFVEEYIKFVRAERDNQSLKDFFKGVDLLLLDDVQFLADKVKTEEMFFYIYQDMINKGKRIIITSDRQPTELKGLEDRLITRFSQGLTVKIEDPDKDTCVEILRKKISEAGIDIDRVDDAVIYFFADKFSQNVRELEGALNRLIFYAINLKQVERITMEVAVEAIGSLKGGNDAVNQLSEQKIINIVADYYNLTPSQITGKTRTGQLVLARHIAMYLIRKHLDIPLKKIGEMFGGKDHTTVMNGISKVEKELKTNEQLKTAISDLEKKIKE